MTDNNDQKRSAIPPLPPLPPHPRQAQLIAEQEQPERINPPTVVFKSSFGEKSDDPLANTSPISNLDRNERTGQTNKQPRKQEELIEAPYLKRILSEGAQLTSAGAETVRTADRPLAWQPQQENASIPGNVPACCYAPACINYINGCKEIKVCVDPQAAGAEHRWLILS